MLSTVLTRSGMFEDKCQHPSWNIWQAISTNGLSCFAAGWWRKDNFGKWKPKCVDGAIGRDWKHAITTTQAPLKSKNSKQALTYEHTQVVFISQALCYYIGKIRVGRSKINFVHHRTVVPFTLQTNGKTRFIAETTLNAVSMPHVCKLLVYQRSNRLGS